MRSRTSPSRVLTDAQLAILSQLRGRSDRFLVTRDGLPIGGLLRSYVRHETGWIATGRIRPCPFGSSEYVERLEARSWIEQLESAQAEVAA